MLNSPERRADGFQAERTGSMSIGYIPDAIDAMDLPGLLDYWATFDDAQKTLAVWKFQLEQRITRAMADKRAEVAKTADVSATFRGVNEFDRTAVEAIREEMPPDEWETYLTKPKPVEPRPNMTKIKALAKEGDPFRSIIENATRVSPPILKLKRLDPKPEAE